MSKETVLITGCAGFIGMHLCKSLLRDGYEIMGIDNINNYYSTKLKYDRLDQLKDYTNFTFMKLDLVEKSELFGLFNQFKPDKVVNLAAQAGVRYSIENPYAYMESNFVGFLNILEGCRKYSVKGLVYASSSSVYGGNKKIPFSVADPVNQPISLYAASKRSNELMAYSYSHLYGLHTTGLRFFTVYGPWGRPDMAMYIFAEKISRKKPIDVYNKGDMKRDFTYIDDIIQGTRAALEENYSCEVFNLGNHKSEELMDMIHIIEENLGMKAEMNFKPMQPGDVKETFADIDHSMDMLRYNPTTDINKGVKQFIYWYKNWISGEV